MRLYNTHVARECKVFFLSRQKGSCGERGTRRLLGGGLAHFCTVIHAALFETQMFFTDF